MDFLKIVGAGTTAVNGLYELIGEREGRPHYSNGAYEIGWFANSWKIYVTGTDGGSFPYISLKMLQLLIWLPPGV